MKLAAFASCSILLGISLAKTWDGHTHGWTFVCIGMFIAVFWLAMDLDDSSRQ